MKQKIVSAHYIQFCDWHICPRNAEYTLIIDFDASIMTIKTRKTNRKEKIQIKELDAEIVSTLLDFLDYNSVMTFLNTPEDILDESGYRDGWCLKYELSYHGKPVLSRTLGTIYSGSPFENVLNYLKREFQSIDELRHF